MIIKRFFYFFYYRFLLRNKPYVYAKKIGVNVQNTLFIYGGRVGMFGTEPWLISFGNNVHITGNCQFITHDGSTLILRDKNPDLELTFPIEVGKNVYFGYGTTVLPGVTIGDNVIIGAGSVVNKDLPPNTVCAGVPCKVIKKLDKFREEALGKSLNLGHLKGKEKETALKIYYKIK